jgi:hypothetical protein
MHINDGAAQALHRTIAYSTTLYSKLTFPEAVFV